MAVTVVGAYSAAVGNTRECYLKRQSHGVRGRILCVGPEISK